MIIEYQEGMENWDIPYFEGIQSVKMPVLTTTGKNLFNDDLLVNKDIIINIDGVDVYKPIITSSYEFGVTSDSGFRLKNNIFKDNTQYTLSFKFIENSSSALHKQIIYRYTDGDTYQSWSEREGVVCYTTKANKTLETISVISRNTDGTNFGIYDVQLEEGSVLTDYEPYKSNILTVNEEVELRGVGDVRDELDLLTMEVTQRIGEVILNGETTANGHTSVDGYIGQYARHMSHLVDGKNEKLYLQGFVGNIGNSKGYILTNGFVQYKGFKPNDSELEEGLYRYSGSDHAYICISASRFTEHTFEGIKKFLS